MKWSNDFDISVLKKQCEIVVNKIMKIMLNKALTKTFFSGLNTWMCS